MFHLPTTPVAGDPIAARDVGSVISGVSDLDKRGTSPLRRPRRYFADDAGSATANRFPNQIRALDAEADKALAVANGGTIEGTEPWSVFLNAILDAMVGEYVTRCIVVEPNRMLAPISDASPTNPNNAVLEPAPQLVVIPELFFGEWSNIGRMFTFNADYNTFTGTVSLVHPTEGLVSGEGADDYASETNTVSTDESNPEYKIDYVSAGTRLAFIGRVMLADAIATPVIEQNIAGVVKLVWNIGAKLTNLFGQVPATYGNDTVDFKIYPLLHISDGFEPLSAFNDARHGHWSFFAPNPQLYVRPHSLVLSDTAFSKQVGILPDKTGAFGNEFSKSLNRWVERWGIDPAGVIFRDGDEIPKIYAMWNGDLADICATQTDYETSFVRMLDIGTDQISVGWSEAGFFQLQNCRLYMTEAGRSTVDIATRSLPDGLTASFFQLAIPTMFNTTTGYPTYYNHYWVLGCLDTVSYYP